MNIPKIERQLSPWVLQVVQAQLQLNKILVLIIRTYETFQFNISRNTGIMISKFHCKCLTCVFNLLDKPFRDSRLSLGHIHKLEVDFSVGRKIPHMQMTHSYSD